MGVMFAAAMAVLTIGLGWAATMLASSFALRSRRRPDEPLTRFEAGWLGAFGMLIGLACSNGLCLGLAEFVGSSRWAIVAAVLLNCLAQPVWLLMAWSALRKLTLGLSGRVAYAWREVSPDELASFSTAERRSLGWYCVFQGAILLPFGLAGSFGCALPLLRAFFG